MELITINLYEIVQNDFNCKIFDEIKFNQLKSSIQKYGLLKHPIVRLNAGGQYELIDGRFRARALFELGIAQAEFMLISAPERSDALKLYLWLNDFSFEIDHVRLLAEINTLQSIHDNKALEKLIPYTKEDLTLYSSLYHFDWSMYEEQENKQQTLF